MKARELSSFCMQISFLLEAGIAIDSGLAILAEDAADEREKNMFMNMAEETETGMSLAGAMKQTAEFPDYVVEMSQIGQETGNLEVVMKSLSDYYEKEESMAQNIKNAVTYPVIMVSMLMVVLFVLLTKVMPIFEGVYRQLGAELSPVTQSAVKVGSILSGGALVLIAVLVIAGGGIMAFSKKGHSLQWTERLLGVLKEKSGVAVTLAKRRIAAVMAIAIKSGLEIDAGIDMAGQLISQKTLKEKLESCKTEMEMGKPMYDALKEIKVFTSMDLQMIKVGVRSGKSDVVFDELAKKYENEVDTAIDNTISRFEPTMVVVLAIVVGLILLSVMMPLVGIMASIG